jgi:hypothetical protein
MCAHHPTYPYPSTHTHQHPSHTTDKQLQELTAQFAERLAVARAAKAETKAQEAVR